MEGVEVLHEPDQLSVVARPKPPSPAASEKADVQMYCTQRIRQKKHGQPIGEKKPTRQCFKSVEPLAFA